MKVEYEPNQSNPPTAADNMKLYIPNSQQRLANIIANRDGTWPVVKKRPSALTVHPPKRACILFFQQRKRDMPKKG